MATEAVGGSMNNHDLRVRIDAIEDGYEFFLAYAAQGITDESADAADEQVRGFLRGFAEALDGLADAFRGALANREDAADDDKGTATEAVLAVLDRDAQAAGAFVQFVMAQKTISSQLIDNLNGSIHIRALLTEVFVLGEAAGV